MLHPSIESNYSAHQGHRACRCLNSFTLKSPGIHVIWGCRSVFTLKSLSPKDQDNKRGITKWDILCLWDGGSPTDTVIFERKDCIPIKPFRSRKRSSSDSLGSFGPLFYSFAHETNFRPEDGQLITITKQIETVDLPKPSYMTSNIAESKFPTPKISWKSEATSTSSSSLWHMWHLTAAGSAAPVVALLKHLPTTTIGQIFNLQTACEICLPIQNVLWNERGSVRESGIFIFIWKLQ